jgi:NADPH2:quinone reductase
VIGTAGAAEKVAAVRALGADLVLSYARDDVIAAVRDFAGEDGVDRVVDTAFSESIALASEVLRLNGVIASYSSDACWNPEIPFQTLMRKNIVIRPFGIFAMPRAAQDRAFADITAALRAGVLRHRIGRMVGFGEMAAAHTEMDGGGVWGGLVVEVAGKT